MHKTKLASLLLSLSLSAAAGCGPSDSGTPDVFVPGEPDAAGPDAATPPGPDAAGPDAAAPGPDAAGPDSSVPVDMDIRDIQQMVVPTNSAVRIADVVVTARGDGATSTVLFVQEPTGAPEWSGIFVFVDTDPAPAFALPIVGDLVTIEGTVAEFQTVRTNIDPVTNIEITSSGNPLPAPALVAEQDLVIGAPTAEQWEGVLVRVENVTVMSTEPAFGEFLMTGGLEADDRLFVYTLPFPGDTFAALVGPIDQAFGTARILPRSVDDIIGYVAAPPVLIDLQPPTTSIGEGESATYTVTIDRPAPAGGTTIDLGTTDANVALPAANTVVVLQDETTADFIVNGINPGTATITATFGAGTPLEADIEVLAGPDPILTSLSPATLDVMANGGTAIITANLDRVAPAGGSVINITSSSDPDVAVPLSVTVPEGAMQVGFRIRADATGAAGPVTITATLAVGGSQATSTASVVTTALAPVVGDLVINEINYDVPTAAGTNGDANCDGTSDSTDDEFVELTNLSSHPVELMSVSLWDATAWGAGMGGGTARFSFPASVLGPGESVVVFGGAAPTSATHPWCTNLSATTIGDATVFITGSSGFGLNNSPSGGGTVADTVHLTSGISNETAAELVTAVELPSGSDESWTRSPDFTGSFVFDTTVPNGATDRDWTPGTLVTGQPFSAANP